MADIRCFYCDEAIGSNESKRPEIDHFIPWSRFPNDNIENLVISHAMCNRRKRNHIVNNDHLDNWVDHLNQRAADLNQLAGSHSWTSDISRSGEIASSVYRGLPEGFFAWVKSDTFEVLDLQRALNSIANIVI